MSQTLFNPSSPIHIPTSYTRPDSTITPTRLRPSQSRAQTQRRFTQIDTLSPPAVHWVLDTDTGLRSPSYGGSTLDDLVLDVESGEWVKVQSVGQWMREVIRTGYHPGEMRIVPRYSIVSSPSKRSVGSIDDATNRSSTR